MFNNMNLETIIVTVIALLTTIVLHELAHGYTALLLGDDTAQRMGRLTFNPLAHINLPGMLSLFLFRFGWANPVPINFNKLRKKRLGIFLVSIAGISVNLLVAFISSFGYVYTISKNMDPVIVNLFFMLLVYNISFAVFNLLPLPPLDGSKLIITLFPYRIQQVFYKYERYFYFVLLILVFSRIINDVISPIVQNIFSLFVNNAARLILK